MRVFTRVWERLGVLKNRDFLSFWLGMFPYSLAFRMTPLAQGWLVYEMTKSPLLLGLLAALSGAPQFVLSLFGGILADRMRKKSLLLVTEVILGVDALALAMLVSRGVVEYWHVIVFALIWNVASTFSLPSRLAYVSEIVRKEEFMNAYSLYYVVLSLMGIAGPTIAGVLVSVIGVAGVFLIIALCRWSVDAALLMIRGSRTAPVTGPSQPKQSLIHDVTELLSFARHSPTILTLMGIGLTMSFLFTPVVQTLMPVFAVDILGVGAIGLGMLQAASGVGSLAGSLIVASIAKTKRKTLILLYTCLARGLLLPLFAVSRIFPLSLSLMLVSGIMTGIYTILNSSLYQLSATDALRGRITGLYTLGTAFTSIGALPMSAVAQAVNTPLAVGVGGALLILISAAVYTLRPSFRRLSL